MDKEIESLIETMTKDGKSAGEISKAVQEKLKAANPPPQTQTPQTQTPQTQTSQTDEGLIEKAAKEKNANDEKKKADLALEQAITFNLKLSEFVKDNKDLLPEDVDGLISQAEKENYKSVVEKTLEIKSAIVQSFFSIEKNHEELTATQKAKYKSYMALTKDEKIKRAADIFENIFEPTLETIRKIRKAEQLGRANSGYADSDNKQENYKNKMIAQARKNHLGENANA